ncbi:uncharacterized protein F5891DRAFT_1185829 [Suillus fuscotomentosus]|uniref:SEP domain-containing protein n=1 Tax=Suillus fuscotomentosus TaxID=1912939 RepID=A0AAD4EBF2_9AGAM|nr:uncharacterized protein F5891DRAFT_1185829 [Suillus fuscotomentosus]KAG1903188.1 hypothetical protein F5891DRAFT_1185829 [Suillus fuscotomentosus]
MSLLDRGQCAEELKDVDPDIDDDVDIHEISPEPQQPGHIHPITNYFAIARALWCRDEGSVPVPLCSFSVGCTAFNLGYDPSIRSITINEVTVKFDLPDLWLAIADFLQCEATHGHQHIHAIGGPRRAGPTADLPFDKLQTSTTLIPSNLLKHLIVLHPVVPGSWVIMTQLLWRQLWAIHGPVVVSQASFLSHITTLVLTSTTYPADHTITQIRLIVWPIAEELAIPLSSVPQSARLDGLHTFSVEPDGVPMINLYDTEKHWWNWVLPSSYECNCSPTKHREQKGVKSNKGEWILVNEAATNVEKLTYQTIDTPTTEDTNITENSLSESILSGGAGSFDDQMPSSNSKGSLDSSNDGNEAMAGEEDFNQSLTEHIFGSFFNVISVALLAKQPELAQKHHLSCNWSTANSSHPDLKDLEVKAASEGNGEGESEVESKNKSEGENEGEGQDNETTSQDTTKIKNDDDDPLCAPLPEPIGKIRVYDHYYDMLEIIFSSQGLIRHGSICYLARKDKEEFIIKDHWVLGGEEAMNEINMMKKMSGACGVPTLIEHWFVESGNKVD